VYWPVPHIAVPFRSDMAAVVHGAAAGHPAWPLPQCTHARRQSWVSAGPRACGLPLSGRPRPVSARPTAATSRLRRPGPLDQCRRASATWAALPWCRNGSSGSAAVLPQPAAQPGTAAGVQGVADPDKADAVAVRCFVRNGGRCPDGWSVSGRLMSAAYTSAACGCPRLQEAVARPAAAGRVPPLPVGVGELAAEPVAELGAQVGHRRSLQRQGLLGGQPAQPQP
jgi:hypothetical protein